VIVISAEEIKALIHRFFEGVNKGKAAAIAVVDELCATDFVLHCARGKDIRGIKNYKQNVSELFSAVPDAHFTINDMVVEGDKVATRYTLTGTHKATDKKVTTWGITIDRIAGGRFVEEWERYDTLGLMQQLGIVPTPGEKKKEKV
jgi:predicted ester cyclase